MFFASLCSPPVFYSGAAAALQDLQELNNQSGATYRIDYDDDEEEEEDEDEEDEDEDEEDACLVEAPLERVQPHVNLALIVLHVQHLLQHHHQHQLTLPHHHQHQPSSSLTSSRGSSPYTSA